jgi:hypothetical protein
MPEALPAVETNRLNPGDQRLLWDGLWHAHKPLGHDKVTPGRSTITKPLALSATYSP